jgi:hypothetical protein
MRSDTLGRSAALWNRAYLELESDEVLSQILDRGSLEDWRDLYRLAGRDATLRERLHRLLRRVPLPYPGFWLAALANLGVDVDWSMRFPEDTGL